MAGANYMGGKRNAAKARIKDHTGRIQKGFFGKQRLDILSKGLAANSRSRENTTVNAASNLSATQARTPVRRDDITLSHAKHADSRDKSKITMGYSYIQSPVRISPCTPSSREKGRKTGVKDASSSISGGTRSSKVLDALDTTEPTLLRGFLDRILAMPDLAGFARSDQGRHKRPQPFKEEEEEDGRERKRQKTDAQDYRSQGSRNTYTKPVDLSLPPSSEPSSHPSWSTCQASASPQRAHTPSNPSPNEFSRRRSSFSALFQQEEEFGFMEIEDASFQDADVGYLEVEDVGDRKNIARERKGIESRLQFRASTPSSFVFLSPSARPVAHTHSSNNDGMRHAHPARFATPSSGKKRKTRSPPPPVPRVSVRDLRDSFSGSTSNSSSPHMDENPSILRVRHSPYGCRSSAKDLGPVIGRNASSSLIDEEEAQSWHGIELINDDLLFDRSRSIYSQCTNGASASLPVVTVHSHSIASQDERDVPLGQAGSPARVYVVFDEKLTPREVPAAASRSPSKPTSTEMDEGEKPFCGIFEQEDPWEAIGLLMGLHSARNTGKKSSSSPVSWHGEGEAEAEVEAPGVHDVPGDEYDSILDELDQEQERVEVEENAEEDDWRVGMSWEVLEDWDSEDEMDEGGMELGKTGERMLGEEQEQVEEEVMGELVLEEEMRDKGNTRQEYLDDLWEDVGHGFGGSGGVLDCLGVEEGTMRDHSSPEGHSAECGASLSGAQRDSLLPVAEVHEGMENLCRLPLLISSPSDNDDLAEESLPHELLQELVEAGLSNDGEGGKLVDVVSTDEATQILSMILPYAQSSPKNGMASLMSCSPSQSQRSVLSLEGLQKNVLDSPGGAAQFVCSPKLDTASPRSTTAAVLACSDQCGRSPLGSMNRKSMFMLDRLSSSLETTVDAVPPRMDYRAVSSDPEVRPGLKCTGSPSPFGLSSRSPLARSTQQSEVAPSLRKSKSPHRMDMLSAPELKEVDGVFQGPCLFFDDSDEDE